MAVVEFTPTNMGPSAKALGLFFVLPYSLFVLRWYKGDRSEPQR